MKKSLIALAALAAAGVASAQVTLYGVADVSLSKASNSSFQMSGNGDLNNGDSRLGVRGSEDLGGGLTASFQFEQGLNLETGATNAPTEKIVYGGKEITYATGANSFQRTAKVSLAGSFGSVYLGRSLSPTFLGLAAWELTGLAGYSAVVTQFGFVGGVGGLRNNSAIAYQTPQMGAVSAQIAYVNKADNADNSKLDMNVVYAAGPVSAALTYYKAANDASASYSLGGRYNIDGTFSVAGSIQNPSGASRGITIGAAANLGAANLVFDIARESGNAVKSTTYVFEANRSLSKRTLAYFAVLRDGGTSVTTTGAGLRHNF